MDPLQQIRKKAGETKRIVFVSGNFNVLHPGHLRLLRFASECGDFLVVGVCADGHRGTHVAESLRLETVAALAWVDFAFVLRQPAEHFIKELQPAVVVKGKEFETLENPEQAAVDQYGGKLLFGSGDISFSSINLLQKEFKEFNPSTIVLPRDFPARHTFTNADAAALIRTFSGLRVAVVGDLIVDEYVTCDPLGLSAEDPTIVVTPLLQEKFVGGAGIVAAHARTLGASVDFFSVVGRDETASFAAEKLESYGVRTHFHADESRPTTLKQRFRAHNKTLLRVSHLRQHDISQTIARSVYTDLETRIASFDLLVFSDFNYGCLPTHLVNDLSSLGAARGLRMVADSQSSSQVGDVSRFHGMSFLKPTEREARLAVRDFTSGIVVVAERLRTTAQAATVLMTLGSEGVLIHTAWDNDDGWLTDRLPAFNTAAKDPAGAGDSFLAASSLALTAGGSIWLSSFIGSLAAACQVGRLGNIPLTSSELIAELESVH